MTQTISIIVLLLILFAALWFLYRSIEKQINRVVKGEQSLDDGAIWLRNAKPLPARIMYIRENRNPDAGGITKVDLELEVQIPEGQRVPVKTCWLVEIARLSELEVGKNVEVKFDPKKPKRVYPSVPWARLWMFGK